jgi:hypothetical protein
LFSNSCEGNHRHLRLEPQLFCACADGFATRLHRHRFEPTFHLFTVICDCGEYSFSHTDLDTYPARIGYTIFNHSVMKTNTCSCSSLLVSNLQTIIPKYLRSVISFCASAGFRFVSNTTMIKRFMW